MSVKRAHSQISAQTVRILTSDPTTRTVEGRLRDGGTIRIWTLGSLPPFFRWPVPEEIWKVTQTNGRWELDSIVQRIDTGENTQRVEDLQPGEAMLHAKTIRTEDGKVVLTAPDDGQQVVRTPDGVQTIYDTVHDTTLPWRIEVNPSMTPDAQLNWSDFDSNSSAVLGGYLVSTGDQNAFVAWNITLASGTWEFQLLHHRDIWIGIYTITLGTTTLGTIDGYEGVQNLNVRTTISGINVATTGTQQLKLTMATKNALSTAYGGIIGLILMRRTA